MKVSAPAALVLALGIAFGFAPATPSLALTTKEKMDTCKFGAADQQLTGKKEQEFIRKCMAKEPAAKAAAKPPAQKK